MHFFFFSSYSRHTPHEYVYMHLVQAARIQHMICTHKHFLQHSLIVIRDVVILHCHYIRATETVAKKCQCSRASILQILSFYSVQFLERIR